MPKSVLSIAFQSNKTILRYSNCLHSNLNGYNYNAKDILPGRGILWKSWRGMGHSLRGAEMAIRPKCMTKAIGRLISFVLRSRVIIVSVVLYEDCHNAAERSRENYTARDYYIRVGLKQRLTRGYRSMGRRRRQWFYTWWEWYNWV